MDSGDGCTSMNMLNVNKLLFNILNSNFMLCIFYNWKKERFMAFFTSL
jgi:hypothetical protein